jgi:hypothetical protein
MRLNKRKEAAWYFAVDIALLVTSKSGKLDIIVLSGRRV